MSRVEKEYRVLWERVNETEIQVMATTTPLTEDEAIGYAQWLRAGGRKEPVGRVKLEEREVLSGVAQGWRGYGYRG